MSDAPSTMADPASVASSSRYSKSHSSHRSTERPRTATSTRDQVLAHEREGTAAVLSCGDDSTMRMSCRVLVLATRSAALPVGHSQASPRSRRPGGQASGIVERPPSARFLSFGLSRPPSATWPKVAPSPHRVPARRVRMTPQHVAPSSARSTSHRSEVRPMASVRRDCLGGASTMRRAGDRRSRHERAARRSRACRLRSADHHHHPRVHSVPTREPLVASGLSPARWTLATARMRH